MPGATFTSNATRTLFLQNGLLSTVAPNIPRTSWIGGVPYFWADPAVTEISGRSYDLTNWAQSGASTLKNAVGMDGEANGAFTVTDSQLMNASSIANSVTVVSGTTTYFRTFRTPYNAAPAVYPRFFMGLFNGTARRQGIVFNPANGGYNATNTDGSVVFVFRVGNFWHICLSLTDNNTGNTNFATEIYPAYNADGSSTIDVAAIGSTVVASSEAYTTNFSFHPILTTGGSTAAIPAEVATINPLFAGYNQARGTFISQYLLSRVPPSGISNVVFSLDDTTTSNRMIHVVNDDAFPRFTVTEGGASQANLSSGVTVSNMTMIKSAIGYAQDDFSISVNGSAAQTDTSGNVPAVTRMGIGNSVTFASAQLNGGINTLTYVPRRLTNAELQARSA